jgi:hypothetical protein
MASTGPLAACPLPADDRGDASASTCYVDEDLAGVDIRHVEST